MISGFLRGVNEIFDPLGCRRQRSRYPETSVTNYQSVLRNIPEKRRLYLILPRCFSTLDQLCPSLYNHDLSSPTNVDCSQTCYTSLNIFFPRPCLHNLTQHCKVRDTSAFRDSSYICADMFTLSDKRHRK